MQDGDTQKQHMLGLQVVLGTWRALSILSWRHRSRPKRELGDAWVMIAGQRDGTDTAYARTCTGSTGRADPGTLPMWNC